MKLLTTVILAACFALPFSHMTVVNSPTATFSQSVSTQVPPESPLKTLDWLVGDWSAQQGDGSINFKCHFSIHDAFLIRSFSATDSKAQTTSGMQIIAWDPAQNKIRSWTYDSQGGFGEDTWTQNENRYTLRATYTFADGGKASMLNVATLIDNDHLSWKSVQLEIDGEFQPDVAEIVFARTAVVDSKSGAQQ